MTSLKLFIPDFGPLAAQPVYQRHLLVGERAVATGMATLFHPEPARVEDLLLFHSPEYVEALAQGVPDPLASSGGTWFPGLMDFARSIVGASFASIEAAARDGVSGLLGGGGHHAYPTRGGALSWVNEIGIGVHHFRRLGFQRVLVLDLDAHFGNGTVAGFPDDPDLFLFDLHGHASDWVS